MILKFFLELTEDDVSIVLEDGIRCVPVLHVIIYIFQNHSASTHTYRVYKPTLNSLQTLLANLYDSRGTADAISTIDFTNATNSNFDPTTQEDVHEYIVALCDSILLELPQNKKKIFEDLITIKGIDEVVCSVCNRKRYVIYYTTLFFCITCAIYNI